MKNKFKVIDFSEGSGVNNIYSFCLIKLNKEEAKKYLTIKGWDVYRVIRFKYNLEELQSVVLFEADKLCSSVKLIGVEGDDPWETIDYQTKEYIIHTTCEIYDRKRKKKN